MSYNRFQVQCIVRVVLLGITLYLFFFLIFFTNFRITLAFFVIVPVLQLAELMHYVQKTNRALTHFLQSIHSADFTAMLPQNSSDPMFRDLYQALNLVMQRFQHIRMEREAQYMYLQTVVQHIGIGVIAFTADGTIDLINQAFKRMFGIRTARRLADLETRAPELHQLLLHITDRHTSLFTLPHDSREEQFAVSATRFWIHHTSYTLVSFQDIHSELEAHEMQSWQKLIRVLNHEIMNSLTPITSLTSTASAMVETMLDNSSDDEDRQALEKLRTAIGILEKRSHGLLGFVNSYRQLTRLPKPVFQPVRLASLCARIDHLFHDQLKEKDIILRIHIEPEDLSIHADENLVEQVLLNLIKNAIFAVEQRSDALIAVTAKQADTQERVVVHVSDNGHGIKAQVLEKIFIPFFTTKNQGSGIGLSLSREIMRLHGGRISVQSQPHVQTLFTLHFDR
jgi:nitrogen fixation/metabolism regulation signal transduction histidine kinase